MRIKRSRIAAAALVAIAGGGAGFGVAQAQTTERIEITGSAIKRVDAESALPVTTFKREDIDRSGFTTAGEFIQSLPTMQGFLTSSQSVNGGGGGATNASLHSIGSAYTLVLLNGRRMAPYNTGTTINLQSIPLSAVDRIEVLTDGASALYGADAIAGVVNFILKKDVTDGTLSVQANKPQKKGGESANASITKGFGNLDKDGFNVLLSFATEKQKVLRAADRDFSKSGVGPTFSYKGTNVAAYNTSSNSIPGTVILNSPDPDIGTIGFYTPALLETGKCGALSFERNDVCRFDFAATVDTIPESSRNSFFASGRLKLSSNHQAFGEFVYSDFKTTPQYAPPAQPGIFLTQALYNAHVKPLLGQLELTEADIVPVGDPSFLGPSMNLRLYDAGKRTNEYRTKTTHFVAGLEGTLGKFDYTTYFTHSENKFTDTLQGGYTSSIKFNQLVDSGAFDPLAAGIGQSVGVLAPAVYKGKLFDTSKSSLDVFSIRGSTTIGKIDNRDIGLALGADYSKQKYADSPSDLAMGQNALQPTFTDTPIGGSSGALPFDSSRTSKGAFAEVLLPITPKLELTGAARFDSYGAVKNSRAFDLNGNPAPAETQGRSASSGTYKLSLRFKPMDELLLRGSAGTGFKAPTLANISNSNQAFGSTGFHQCPPGLATSLAAFCKTGSSEYNKRVSGNPLTNADGLSPEKSFQYTMGFRFEPSPVLSFGVDYWQVKIKNRVDVLPEDVAFSDGAKYASSFSVVPDPVTGAPTLTFTEAPANQGKARYSGLDFDISSTVATPVGKLSSDIKLTYMIVSQYQVPGLDGYQTSLGGYGPDTENTFRWILGASTSLQTGAFTNTLNLIVKPGYADAPADQDPVNGCTTPTCVRLARADGTYGGLQTIRRRVNTYALIDWQGKWAATKDLTVTLGIKNLFDRDPPLSIQAYDGTGNVRGFDARYTDPLGRQFYGAVNYKF